uniref:MULE transposase domain-containing protein n=2 Tax=Globodera rostochiensis TaxID=31243 RepID=A0A914I6Q8_GLORO
MAGQIRFAETKSSRGKLLLSHGGYEYTFEALSKIDDGSEYWRCPIRPPYCPGRACVYTRWEVDADGTQYKVGRITGEHNHAPVFGGRMVREACERIRVEARSDFPTTSRNIVRAARSDLPAEVRIHSAPSPADMRRTFNYQKRKHQQEANLIANCIPDRLQNRVIYDQNIHGERMIIFCSHFALETLSRYRQEVAVDGTFESCPRGFSQLYTMSVVIDHCAVPVVYGLLPNKTFATYTRFFEAIRAAVAYDWFPLRIMSDFEAGAVNAAGNVFPNSTRTGCLFHFGQSVWRRIQRLPNLLTRYRDDEYVRTSMRSMQALAFVPPQFVYNYFCIVMSTLEPTPELQEFILYFVNTWLGPRQIIQNEEILEEDAGGAADNWIRGQIEALNLALTDALFPIELWNVMERVNEGLGRTNNSVEGWHSAWNVHLKGNQRASSFARKMVEEDETWQHIVTDFQAAPADGIKGPYNTRKAQYIRQDRNLEALVADFQNRDPLEFLRSCAYHLRF